MSVPPDVFASPLPEAGISDFDELGLPLEGDSDDFDRAFQALHTLAAQPLVAPGFWD